MYLTVCFPCDPDLTPGSGGVSHAHALTRTARTARTHAAFLLSHS